MQLLRGLKKDLGPLRLAQGQPQHADAKGQVGIALLLFRLGRGAAVAGAPEAVEAEPGQLAMG